MTTAKRVHARLANNVWKSRLLTWNVKWRLWQALVLSVIIYCLEAHTLTGGMITKLDRWATRCLRQIARVPAHVTHVSNNALRRKFKVATIGSILARKRLLFWKKLLRPWFMDDGRHDTSLMPRLVCLGRISFEEESDEPRRTARMEQLSKDLILLRDALKDCAGGGPNAERLLQPMDPRDAELTVCKAPAEQITARPSDDWLRCLAFLNDSAISTILTWEGRRHDEDTHRICPTCGCTCSGERGLSIHMAQWCGTDKHQSQSIKRAEWAATTGNSLGRQSWSAQNKSKPIRPSHVPMPSAPVDTTMSKPQTSVVPSATTSASAQRALPDVPQLTATHQSRDSEQTRLEGFLSTKRQKRDGEPCSDRSRSPTCDSERGQQKAQGHEKSDRRGGRPSEGQQAGDGPGETRPATRERKTSPRQERQRSLLDALFGRAGEGTSVGGRQVRGDRLNSRRNKARTTRAIPTARSQTRC